LFVPADSFGILTQLGVIWILDFGFRILKKHAGKLILVARFGDVRNKIGPTRRQ
jgi:hypothetical protein